MKKTYLIHLILKCSIKTMSMSHRFPTGKLTIHKYFYANEKPCGNKIFLGHVSDSKNSFRQLMFENLEFATEIFNQKDIPDTNPTIIATGNYELDQQLLEELIDTFGFEEGAHIKIFSIL